MKKLCFLLAALIAVSAVSAKPKQMGFSEIYVYGIDFSLTKINAAKETNVQFADAFERINLLLLEEPRKFDFGKAFRTTVLGTDIAPTQHNNETCDLETMRTETMKLAPEEAVAELVKAYELPQTEGVGMVMVALQLNKADNRATYDVVFFDIATRKVLFNSQVIGKAGGFGLRNFWAGSVYDVLKHWK